MPITPPALDDRGYDDLLADPLARGQRVRLVQEVREAGAELRAPELLAGAGLQDHLHRRADALLEVGPGELAARVGRPEQGEADRRREGPVGHVESPAFLTIDRGIGTQIFTIGSHQKMMLSR